MSHGGPLDGASPARVIALTVRFLLELALLAGTAVLAWQLAPGGWRWLTVFLAPIVVAAGWGLLLSPKAPVALPGAARLLIEAALFLGVGAGLILVGHVGPAVIGVVVWALDRLALGRVDASGGTLQDCSDETQRTQPDSRDDHAD